MNSRLAQVRSVVMDRSTPPIQYAPRKSSRSKSGFIVYIVKGKPRRFYGFPDVEFLAQNAGKFIPVLLCPFNLLRSGRRIS
jgi:hypothetical protein